MRVVIEQITYHIPAPLPLINPLYEDWKRREEKPNAEIELNPFRRSLKLGGYNRRNHKPTKEP